MCCIYIFPKNPPLLLFLTLAKHAQFYYLCGYFIQTIKLKFLIIINLAFTYLFWEYCFFIYYVHVFIYLRIYIYIYTHINAGFHKKQGLISELLELVTKNWPTWVLETQFQSSERPANSSTLPSISPGLIIISSGLFSFILDQLKKVFHSFQIIIIVLICILHYYVLHITMFF